MHMDDDGEGYYNDDDDNEEERRRALQPTAESATNYQDQRSETAAADGASDRAGVTSERAEW